MKFTNFSIEEILKPDFGTKCPGNVTARCSTLGHGPSSPRSYMSGTIVKLESLEERLGGSLSFVRDDSSHGQTIIPKTENRSECKNTGPISSVNKDQLFPAWVYCTRYSDRPSAGPRSKRQPRRTESGEPRHRTSFSKEQIDILTDAFTSCPYLTEEKRCSLSKQLRLHESQIKIWFQNKRAKSKKSSGRKSALAKNLLEQGLYNHVTKGEDST